MTREVDKRWNKRLTTHVDRRRQYAPWMEMRLKSLHEDIDELSCINGESW